MCGRFATFVAIFAVASAEGCHHQLRIAEGIANCPKIVSREDWGAKEPLCCEVIPHPVKYVVIHHTYSPPACFDRYNCSAAMRSMQNFHQQDRKWCDIGYNFAIGGDGYVYVGRGWGRVGAHAPPYNFNSIGVTLIGDWQTGVPSPEMVNAVKALIKCGVNSGSIAEDYKLIGHRQARTVTECPGQALFQLVKTWPHWSNEWINSSPPPPKINLIESNSAGCSSQEEEKQDARYRVERLRRRRANL